jgi:hypothetical protein
VSIGAKMDASDTAIAATPAETLVRVIETSFRAVNAPGAGSDRARSWRV